MAWFHRHTALDTSLALRVSVAAALLMVACSDRPEDFAPRFERALRSGQHGPVIALLSRASRPLVQAMWASQSPASRPFELGHDAQPIEVLGVQPGEASVVLLVKAGGKPRQWALVHEDGAWRLDLMGTWAHRPDIL